MPSTDESTRRQFLALTGTGVASLAGCATRTDSDTSASRTPTDRPTPTPSTDGTASPTDAITREAVPVDPTADADGLDAVASRLATSAIVGVGETSHGVAAFKTLPRLLVRRLVADHGYRLLAVEGTLGDFAPVDAYVAGENVDVDAALSSLDFYFWRTAEIRRLFEWLREFNDGRPASDRVTVRGYDAQFHDVSATAIRSYLQRVDPAYLAEIDADLDPLTEPRHEESDPAYLTPDQRSLVESLRNRLRAKRAAYVERSSESEWRLARRHVWTLERALRFRKHLQAEAYTRGKRVRDAAMADTVAWLRDWTDSDRAVVLGNANHTMRNDGDAGATRMGQHLTDRFGTDYYSLGLLFGTGTFAAPTNHERTAFETYALDGPVEGSLEATLADAAHPNLFLDIDAARENATLRTWLDGVERIQFSVPRAAERGAVPLSASPGAVYDGVVFVRRVSPAAFGDGDRG